MTTPNRKRYKGSDIVRFKPQDLTLIKSDTSIKVSFEQVGCIRFCKKIQGHNAQLTKEFSLSFSGLEVKVGGLTYLVPDVTISASTKIPLQGEKWFKSMPLDMTNYKDLLKPKY